MTADTKLLGDFALPFVGHLPGISKRARATAAGMPSEQVYNDLLMERWRALLDSPASQDEALIHAFLERHPSLLPGSNAGDSGHAAFPMGVITKPKLPGLSDRQPDFMWIATDSASLYPILIEIETPHKPWFYGKRAEIHSAFTHAQGQLAEWRVWFNRGTNRTTFLDAYEIPLDLRDRRLSPRFVLLYQVGDGHVPLLGWSLDACCRAWVFERQHGADPRHPVGSGTRVRPHRGRSLNTVPEGSGGLLRRCSGRAGAEATVRSG